MSIGLGLIVRNREHYTQVVVFYPTDELARFCDWIFQSWADLPRRAHCFFCLTTDHISTCLTLFSARFKTTQFWSVLDTWWMKMRRWHESHGDLSTTTECHRKLGAETCQLPRIFFDGRTRGKVNQSNPTWCNNLPGVALKQSCEEWCLPVSATPGRIQRRFNQGRGKGHSAIHDQHSRPPSFPNESHWEPLSCFRMCQHLHCLHGLLASSSARNELAAA